MEILFDWANQSNHGFRFIAAQQNHDSSGRPGKLSYLNSSESLASSSTMRDKRRSFFKDTSRRGSRESLESTGELVSPHVSVYSLKGTLCLYIWWLLNQTVFSHDRDTNCFALFSFLFHFQTHTIALAASQHPANFI